MFEAYAPDRAISASNFFVTITGAADDLPPGYEAYCTYLMDWELIASDGQKVAIADVAYSFGNVLTPAYDGQEGKKWTLYTPMFLDVTLSAEGRTAGQCTFRFTLSTIGNTQSLTDGVVQTLEVPVTIAQAPLEVRYNTGHAIPGLTSWEEKMIEVADKWEAQLLDPHNTWGDDNWYYDICSTYLEVGKYIHNSERYWDVAYHAACAYRDYLMNGQTPGAAAPWAVFPRGMRQMYMATRDDQWLDALRSLKNSGWTMAPGSTDPALMRETAYATAVWLELEWVDSGDRALLERGITFLLGQFNLLCAQNFGKGKGMPCQPFFFGLAMQTLIDYYDFVADPRIPQSLMGTCAWLWENAVDARSGYVLYDVWSEGGVNHDNEKAYTGLNPLMYNGWGFLYNLTGDNQWRRQGDILFEHQFADGAYSWSPKQFAQTYRRSTDYVTRWRA